MTALVRMALGFLVRASLACVAASLLRSWLTSEVWGKRSNRRTFVRNAMLGAVLVVVEATGTLIRFAWPNKTGAFGRELTLRRANVPPVGGAPFRYTPGKFFLVHTEDGLLALYWKCPHLGCTVPWNADEQKFHCPCHGSIYLYDGERIAGPAPRPLDLMRVSVLPTGDVTIDTGKISTRTGYKPEQAVPYPV